jgi:nitrite reductase/ring-hydroxylating ferredoxin subunit
MSAIAVCTSDQLQEGGAGVRFKVMLSEGASSAFVVRVNNDVRGYLNRCSHVPVELDWNYGEFLDDSGLVIVCATHGAMYDGETGACMGGPCNGKHLQALDVYEENNQVMWRPSDKVQPHPDGIED